jgi:hypothetical protein
MEAADAAEAQARKQEGGEDEEEAEQQQPAAGAAAAPAPAKRGRKGKAAAAEEPGSGAAGAGMSARIDTSQQLCEVQLSMDLAAPKLLMLEVGAWGWGAGGLWGPDAQQPPGPPAAPASCMGGRSCSAAALDASPQSGASPLCA